MAFWRSVEGCKEAVSKGLHKVKKSGRFKLLHKESKSFHARWKKVLQQCKNGIDNEALVAKANDLMKEHLKHAKET